MRFDSTTFLAAIPLGLALLAVFRYVCESFSMEEFLFSRRKYKDHTTIYTLDISVIEVHKTSSFALRRFDEAQL